MTSNYFKVVRFEWRSRSSSSGHEPRMAPCACAFVFFDGAAGPREVQEAWQKAQAVAAPFEQVSRISVYRKPIAFGPWDSVPLVGDVLEERRVAA